MTRLYAGLFSFCILLCGCATQSPPISTPWQNERLEILALVQTRPLDSKLKLSINGELVIKESTNIFAGSAQNFAGVWRGQRILARMTRKQLIVSSSTRIDVFINGNLVEILRL